MSEGAYTNGQGNAAWWLRSPGMTASSPAYLSSAGDQPHVRAFSSFEIINGRLYVMTGKEKDVYKQLDKNGKFELVAIKPDRSEWIRVSGVLVDDPDIEPQKEYLRRNPYFSNSYQPGDGNMAMLYITTPTPANGILTYGDDLSVEFNEDIVPGYVSDKNIIVTARLNQQSLSHEVAKHIWSDIGDQRTANPIFLSGDFSFDFWLYLQGFKLGRRPSLPGVYIHRGKAVIVRE